MTSAFAAAHADALALLARWPTPDAGQEARRQAFTDLCAQRGPDALDRAAGPVHLTASCIVLDGDAEHVLLVKHRKAGVWVQPGGHIEATDASLAAAAAREVQEETGVDVNGVGWPRLADLHHHGLGHAFGACAEHLDVTFLAVVDRRDARPGPVSHHDEPGPVSHHDEPGPVSAGSEDAAWWPRSALPPGVVPDLPARLARLPVARRIPRCTSEPAFSGPEALKTRDSTCNAGSDVQQGQ